MQNNFVFMKDYIEKSDDWVIMNVKDYLRTFFIYLSHGYTEFLAIKGNISDDDKSREKLYVYTHGIYLLNPDDEITENEIIYPSTNKNFLNKVFKNFENPSILNIPIISFGKGFEKFLSLYNEKEQIEIKAKLMLQNINFEGGENAGESTNYNK